jgi:hypothetical protein
LNAAGAEKFRQNEWLISAILREISHLQGDAARHVGVENHQF